MSITNIDVVQKKEKHSFYAFLDIWVVFIYNTKPVAPLISKGFCALSSTLVLHILFWLLKHSQLIHSQTLQCGTCRFRLIVLFNLQRENDILEGCPMSLVHNLSVKFLYTVFKCCSQSDIIPSLLSSGKTAVEAQEQIHVAVMTFPPEQPLKQ